LHEKKFPFSVPAREKNIIGILEPNAVYIVFILLFRALLKIIS